MPSKKILHKTRKPLSYKQIEENSKIRKTRSIKTNKDSFETKTCHDN